MADCHPILFLRMADRLKAGAKLIVVDPRRTTTADKADLFLQIKPGTDLALLNGLLHLLVENGDIDQEFIAEHTEGWDGDAGVPGRLPARPGRRDHRPGRGRHPHRRGDDRRGRRLDDLLDDGPQPEHARHLEHQRHLQPAPGHRRDLPARQRADVADRPAQRDGRPRDGLHGAGSARPARRCSSADDRAFVEDAVGIWRRAPSAPTSGRAPSTMFEQMAARRDQGLLDHLHQSRCHRGQPRDRHRRPARPPNSSSPRTPTARPRPTRYADIVLPATLWAEADAVMVNSERNLTLLQQSIPPAGDARPDWQLIAGSPSAMGFGDALRLQVEPRRSSTRSAGSPTRAPATTCAASATTGCARPRCSGRARPSGAGDRTPDPLPQRRGQPGPVRRRRRAPAAAGVPHAVAPGGVPRPPAPGRPPSCPTTTTRSCSTPVGCSTSGTP